MFVEDEFSLNKNSLYIGVDESNHGGYGLEIFVAVFSKPIPHEILFDKFSKPRKSTLKLNPELITENYFYTFTTTPQNSSRGIILSSLIKRDLPKNLEQLKIFFDGKASDSNKKYTKSLISDICEIDYFDLEFICESKFDKKCLLVNKADRLAYFINKKFDKRYICFHPNYRGLLN